MTFDGATVLMVGASFSQRRAIRRLRELGARVVAVDGDPEAPGLAEADIGEVVDFADIEAVVAAGRRHGIDGVLTVASDRAVPIVAAVAESLRLPGIGSETARVMTNKIAMRERLAAHGVPQPRFFPVRKPDDLAAAVATLSFPAVLKASDTGGQRGLFKIEHQDEASERLAETLSFSRSGEAILEEFHAGLELNAMVVARGGQPRVLTLSDRLRPPGPGFGVGWIHLYPASLSEEMRPEAEQVAAAATVACGLGEGIAFPQLLVSDDGRVRVVEIGARIAAGQMADLVRQAIGVDLVVVALCQALGKPVPDELVRPRFSRPLAIRFLTAAPGPLPTGKVRRITGLDRVLAAPGVAEAELYLEVGETIRAVQLDIDRRGYVLAFGATSTEALERADSAARLLVVDTE
jgi:biotin carboxylase